MPGSRRDPISEEAPVLGTCYVIAFAPATDLSRAREFHKSVLGLRRVEPIEYAGVFDAHRMMLRITAIADVARPGYTVLGWRVTDIDNAVSDLAERGAVFARSSGMDQDHMGIWAAPSRDRIAWFTDPDGKNLSLAQFS
jgi:predicted enzyme related to lactoylglutathione lyase